MDRHIEANYGAWRRAFLARRIQTGILIVLGLMVFFIVAGWVIFPTQFSRLVLVQLSIIALCILTYFLVRRSGERYVMWLVVGLPTFLGCTVAHMSMLLGGFESYSYVGVILVFVGAAVLLPVLWPLHVLVHGMVIFYYYAVHVILGEGPLLTQRFLYPGLFLVTSSLICVGAVALYERVHRSEVESRFTLEEANRRLWQLNKVKDQFVANVSHELRTPITLIIGVFKKLVLNPDTRTLAEVGLRNASHLLVLVDELLDISRLDTGRIVARKRLIDAARIVRSIVAGFEGTVERSVMSVEGAEAPFLMYADPSLLKKIVHNLLSNAWKFTDPETRKISVRIRKEGEWGAIEVQDNGIGIPEEARERIFERFVQLESEANRRYPGVGLGLSMVKQFTELHGGTVRVESEPGKGSTFTVLLPIGNIPADVTAADLEEEGPEEEMFALVGQIVSQEQPPLQVSSSPSARDTDAPLLLLVEDHEMVRQYLADILSAHYRVELAVDGVEGLEKAQRLRPDVIVTDLMMPRMSGDELVAAIRADESLSYIPIVMLTARSGYEERLSRPAASADDYVIKPFREEELLARIRNVLTLAQEKRKAEALEKEVKVLRDSSPGKRAATQQDEPGA